MRLYGYKVSSSASGQTVGETLDVGVYTISGQINKGPGGLIVCCYDYNYATNRWVPLAH